MLNFVIQDTKVTRNRNGSQTKVWSRDRFILVLLQATGCTLTEVNQNEKDGETVDWAYVGEIYTADNGFYYLEKWRTGEPEPQRHRIDLQPLWDKLGDPEDTKSLDVSYEDLAAYGYDILATPAEEGKAAEASLRQALKPLADAAPPIKGRKTTVGANKNGLTGFHFSFKRRWAKETSK